MPNKISKTNTILLIDSLKRLAIVLGDCDVDCNDCPLNTYIDAYDNNGNKMNKCDLLELVEKKL